MNGRGPGTGGAEIELAMAEAALADLRERIRRRDPTVGTGELAIAARRVVAARRLVSQARRFSPPRRRGWPWWPR